MAKSKPIVDISADEADGYAGNGQDGAYWQTGQDRKGKWFVTVWVDSGTAHFVDNIFIDEGPFASKAAAYEWGLTQAQEWCATNGVRV
jgi:hypothetical protein